MWGKHENALTSSDKVNVLREKFLLCTEKVKMEYAIEAFELMKWHGLYNSLFKEILQIWDLLYTNFKGPTLHNSYELHEKYIILSACAFMLANLYITWGKLKEKRDGRRLQTRNLTMDLKNFWFNSHYKKTTSIITTTKLN